MSAENRTAQAVLFLYLLLVNPWQISAMRHSATDSDSESQAIEEAVMSKLEQGLQWKTCSPLGSRSFRRYYFQVNSKSSQDEEQMAVRFDRDVKKPKLRLYEDQEWQVAFHPDKKEIEWRVEDENAGRTIDLTNTRYITYSSKNGEALEILQEDDDEYQVFIGGVYFPHELMKSALRDQAMKEQDAMDRNSTEVTMAPNARAIKDGGLALGKVAGAGTVAGLAAGTTVGAVFNAALGVLTTSALGISIPTLASSTALGAAIGAAGGLVIGLGVGAGVGLIAGVTKVILRRRYFKREINLSMSTKLFEKLRCHPAFTKCGKDKEGMELLVRKGKKCPSKKGRTWSDVAKHYEIIKM